MPEQHSAVKRITVTIKRQGLPAQRFTGLWACTCDAISTAMDMVGEEACSISAKVAA